MRVICQNREIFLHQINHLLFTALVVLALCLSGLSAGAAEISKPEHAHIKLYASVETVAAGQPFTLVFQQLIDPDWHTYWKNPGDSGTPFTAKISLPDGGTTSPLQFPTPTRIPFGPLMNFGYTGQALFAMTITPPQTLLGETYTINADLSWLVCHDVCIPEGDQFSIILPVTGTAAVANAGIGDIMHDLTASHPMQVDWPVTYTEKEANVVLSIPAPPAVRAVLAGGGTLTFFPEEWGLINNAAPQKVEVLDQALPLRLTIPRGDRPFGDVPATLGIFVVTDPTGHSQGYALTAGVEGRPIPKGGLHEQTLSAQEPQRETRAPQHPDSHLSFGTAALFALLGGIILNLMPCVFPVLSLKILALARLPEKQQRSARLHGLAYGAGVLLSFAVIAIILLTLQSAGSAAGWGFQLQNPLMVTFLFYLFILMGLNLMGFYEVDLNRLIPSRLHGHHDGIVGSFLTGLLATIVATPCTAPFMGSAMAYALTHSPFMGLVIFMMMGTGLALPFVALTFAPRLLHYLPRPGHWMLILRHALAFPMFLSAIWLLWVLGQQTGPDGIAAALMAALSTTAMIWLLAHAPKYKLLQGIRLVTLIALMAALMILTFVQIHPARPSPEGHIAFTPAALQDALAKDQPVFVNMTAAWCITCKVNEHVALSAASVQESFQANNILYIEGDWTSYNADITAYLKQFGRQGVPLYVYYPTAPSTGQARPDPVILPQLLTPAILQAVFTSERKKP